MFVEVRPDGTVAGANAAFARRADTTVDRLVDTPLASYLPGEGGGVVRKWLNGAPLPLDRTPVNFVARGGELFTLLCLLERSDGRLRLLGESDVEEDRSTASELMSLNNELATMARERARRERELERIRGKLQAALDDLKTSYWHLRKIQEFLPICMECGKFKAEGAEWQTLAEYLKANEILLSHGYCPACAETYAERYGLDLAESAEG